MLAGCIEFLGWFGAVTVLTGYLLFSMGKLPNGPVYQLFNLVGGLAVAVNVAAHHAVPSTIVNGIWAIIAVVVLVRTARARRAAVRGGTATLTASADDPAAPRRLLPTEPPMTTAVLPVVGPALRDHEPDAAASVDPVSTEPDATASVDPVSTERGSSDLVSTDATSVAPMTESLPVITATIALALVAAAQQQPVEPDHAGAATR